MNMTEKVKQSGFFSSSFFSSVSTSVSALSQTIQEKGIPEMNKRLNELQQKARELPNQLAKMPLDLESERKTFLKNNTEHTKPKGSESVAPWAGYDGYEKEMKRAIMEISKDKRNFLISPPEDTNFQFDINAYSQNAQAALREDKELSHMRFLLVPQHVSEPTFWKNYFYRVTLVKQTVLSEPIPKDNSNQDVLFDFKDDEEEEKEKEKEKEEKDDGDDDDDDDDFKDTTEDIEEYRNNMEKDNTKMKTDTKSEIVNKSNPKEEEKKEKEDESQYEGMEEWEIELRRQAL